MSMWTRLKSLVGGNSVIYNKTVAAAATLNVPDDLTWVPLTGTATVTALVASPYTRGRLCFFYQSDTGATTFTNSTATTTANQMDLGALDPSNIVLSGTDVLCLYCRPDGSWVRVFHTNN